MSTTPSQASLLIREARVQLRLKTALRNLKYVCDRTDNPAARSRAYDAVYLATEPSSQTRAAFSWVDATIASRVV